MAQPKYLQFYRLMMERHQRLFDQFKPVHDQFAQAFDAEAADGTPIPEEVATAFHTQGRRVLDVVRDWERRLCHGMERGKYAKYSAQLAEKFWDQVRQELPLVDEVGVKRQHLLQ